MFWTKIGLDSRNSKINFSKKKNITISDIVIKLKNKEANYIFMFVIVFKIYY